MDKSKIYMEAMPTINKQTLGNIYNGRTQLPLIYGTGGENQEFRGFFEQSDLTIVIYRPTKWQKFKGKMKQLFKKYKR